MFQVLFIHALFNSFLVSLSVFSLVHAHNPLDKQFPTGCCMPPFWRQVATGHMPLQVSEKQPSCHKRRQAAAAMSISVVSWQGKALAAVSSVSSFRSTSSQLGNVMGNGQLSGNDWTSGCGFSVSAVPRPVM